MENEKKQGNKKIVLLLVLKILEQSSNKDKPLQYQDIINIIIDIGKEFGVDIWCDRKTIGRHLETLKAAGYKIITVKGKGVYLENYKLNINECKCLIRLVENSKLEDVSKECLIKKLTLNQVTQETLNLNKKSEENKWR